MSLRPFALSLALLSLACGPSRREGTPIEEDPVGENCGNGTLDDGEACDPDITTGRGACPTTCAATNACTPVVVTGTAAACTAACTPRPITSCTNGDGCCAPGCGPANDDDCGTTTQDCGNGRVDPGEICDDNCPTTCNDGIACTADTMTGLASRCDVECHHASVTVCRSGDGCCPSGCGAGNDSDCGVCGNGQIDQGETCDANCPSTCDDFDACTTDTRAGSPQNCDVTCSHAALRTCRSNDGCCPSGCTTSNDSDCGGSCGNGRVESGETCDGNCPSSCDDGDACTSDALLGAVDRCTASCRNSPISACRDGDGCCAPGCTAANDSDCVRTCSPACSSGQRCVNGTCTGTPVPIGATCTDTQGCEGGFCATQASAGWPGGYCRDSCSSDNPCPAGAVCLGSTCHKSCTADANCRTPDYRCSALDSSGTKVCAPYGRGSSAIGGACTTAADCNNGERAICRTADAGYKNGLCTQSCENAACPSGTTCGSDKTCRTICTTNAGCRGSGYLCLDTNGDQVRECVPGATGTRSVGEACAGIWDCAGGAQGSCLRDSLTFTSDFNFDVSLWPDGYCTLTCDDTAVCPDATSCDRDFLSELLGLPGHCLIACTDSAQCRVGYACEAGPIIGVETVCRP